MSGDFIKSHLRLLFKIEKVEGDDAIAMFMGHEAGSDYVRALLRRRRSRIDCIVEGKTKDEYRIKIHLVVITRSRLNRSQSKGVRDTTTSYMGEYLEDKTLGEFFRDLLSNAIAREVQSRCRKIAPISGAELVRSHVERMVKLGAAIEEEKANEIEKGETIEVGEGEAAEM